MPCGHICLRDASLTLHDLPRKERDKKCPHATQHFDTGKYLSLWWHRWGCDHLYLRGSGKRLTLTQEFTRKMRMMSQRNGRHCGAGALCVRGHRCWGGFFFTFPSEVSTERCLPDSSIKGLKFLAFYLFYLHFKFYQLFKNAQTHIGCCHVPPPNSAYPEVNSGTCEHWFPTISIPSI